MPQSINRLQEIHHCHIFCTSTITDYDNMSYQWLTIVVTYLYQDGVKVSKWDAP